MLKKGLLGLGICVLASSSMTLASSNIDAFKWGFEQGVLDMNNGLTSTSTLQRQQFAPILLQYIDKVAHKEYTARKCNAKDLYNSDVKYREALEKLCAYGILNGEAGSLYPLWNLTNGQTVALIMRIIDGVQDESTTGGRHWAQGYFDRASQLGFQVTQLNKVKNAAISYEDLVIFLYSTKYPNQSISKVQATSGSTTFSSSDDALKRLVEIMAS